MRRLQHPEPDHIIFSPESDDPFDEAGADSALEAMLNGELPPEAYKDPDELAAEQFIASVEIVEAVASRGVEAVYVPEPEFAPIA